MNPHNETETAKTFLPMIPRFVVLAAAIAAAAFAQNPVPDLAILTRRVSEALADALG